MDATTKDSTMQAYRTLESRFARLSTLEDVGGILHWDLETTMPQGSGPGRAEQIALVSGLSHEWLIAPEIAGLLDEAEAQDDYDPWQSANLREMRRAYRNAAQVPQDLVEASAKASSASTMAWREAKPAGDFARFRPYLEEVVRLRREVAEAKGAALGLSPYDAMLDSFDPGLTQARVEGLFGPLRQALPGLIREAEARQRERPPARLPTGPFPIAAQKALGDQLMQAVGFDFGRGRLDVSAHPFCGGASDDTRITSRYNEADFTAAVMGVLHESGHALYQQGLPQAWRRQPAGGPRGMSLHESQSLILEMQACRTPEFAGYLARLARERFPDAEGLDADNLYRLNLRVRPGFIRVDADEITYPAHILLRFSLERAMINGDLVVADLPGAFNEGMRELLGLTVPDDGVGCMQDIHWPTGLFGYFPTYTIGAMIAAQLFQAACAAEPGLRPALAEGDFTRLRDWLRTNIHQKGCLQETPDLLVAATGKPLDPAIYHAHLRRRYVEG